MRRGVCILSLVLAACLATVGQEGENFVVERTFTSAGEYSDVVTYYDGVGRLAAVETNGGSYRTDYGYNVRGWLTEIVSPLMEQTLNYTEHSLRKNPYMNGNINSITTKNNLISPITGEVMGSGKATVTYMYDKLNRLSTSTYEPEGRPSNPGAYNTAYTYDLNGNITMLSRQGVNERLTDDGEAVYAGYGFTDQITAAYDGNRLLKVTDAAGEVVYGGAFDFNDGADGETEYEYDSNGNMTADLNRSIRLIEYDVNNRPVSVTFSTSPAEQRTEYLRDASGRKLRTTYQISRVMSVGPGGLGQIDTLELNPGIGGIGGIGGLKPLSSPASGLGGSLFDPGLAKDPGGMLDMWQTSYTRDYCGDIIYKDDEIERILTDNGYAVLDARTGGYKYYYYVKDYQGNIRAVLDEAGNVVESNGYYPYGMPYADNYTSVQPYKYGGKELDRTNGLDMYDFHARQYDPAFPCFTSIDELCEKYPSISPYAYCMGNPINAIDPDGRRTWRIRKDGSIYDYSDKNKSFDAFVIVDSKGNTKTDSDGNEICIKFDYGTVTMVENVPVSFGDATYNLTMFHIKGDDNAQQLFEFMANPQETTNVEWSHTKIGTEDSQKNVVGTSGERQHTHQKGYLYEKGYTIRYDAHNHPLGNKASKNDVRSRDTIKRKFPSSEILLYTLKNGIGNYDTIPPIYTK